MRSLYRGEFNHLSLVESASKPDLFNSRSDQCPCLLIIYHLLSFYDNITCESNGAAQVTLTAHMLEIPTK